jgi:carbonic anhydrase/acetyltransferase-like protein (isoleucine patch superfamily)
VGSFSFSDLSSGRAEVAVMDIRAILLIGGLDAETPGSTERFGSIPLACLDVLGITVEERMVRRLQHFGVTLCSVVCDAPRETDRFTQCSVLDSRMQHLHETGEHFWQIAEQTFQSCVEDGAELIIVHRVGSYVEVDYEEMIQHHLDRRSAVTRAVDSEKADLDVFVLSASARTADLRRVAMDGLLGRNGVVPHGTEVKPGIWYGPSARVHRKARVVAPAYIGAHAKIRASALITRGTAIERHAEVDCGTVVENATVLPFSCLGAGLDAMHCVVGFRRLAHLVCDVEVEIHDGKLVGMIPLSAVSRLAGSTAALFGFLPRELYRGLRASVRRKQIAKSADPTDEAEPSPANPVLEGSPSDSEPTEFPSNLAVVRRYGDH